VSAAPITVGAWLERAAGELRRAGIVDPRRDALLLLAAAAVLGKESLLAHPERELPHAAVAVADALAKRRAGREPLQYILGVQEFWGLPVRVGPGCLIPRPETEHLVETALHLLRDRFHPKVAEVGTGSGCVLLALATERPDARLTGIELEDAALHWSRLNLVGRTKVHLQQGDMGAAPPSHGYDLVLSNPPYVTDGEWGDLAPEVRDHEPASALRCGPEPLGPYRSLTSWAAAALKPGGFLACELGVAQARRAAALRRLHPGLAWHHGARDLAGRLRVAVWEKRD
jgi:release factor glutamine methyltransferase